MMRRQLAFDRADTERAAAKTDPLAGLLTGFGVAAGRVDLVAGMAFAFVVEGVACFCWLLALWPADTTDTTVTTARGIRDGLSVTRVTRTSTLVPHAGNGATGRRNTADSPAVEQANELTRVLTAVSNGTLRGTVTEIRKHLGCSQAKAAALRKQLAQQMQSSRGTNEE
ncbi:UNVERIFIED_ORG: hypothetical protein J2Y81_007390 [Paraburkholderia sediminicola]|nr:hypothetical protein [Paraburkholderia sediminicola]